MGDWVEEEYSWEKLARDQLTKQSWETLEDGDMLALFHRDCITEDWSGASRRCFARIVGSNAFIFNAQGEPIDDPANFVTKGCQPLNGDHGFMEEFDGGEGELFYTIPKTEHLQGADEDCGGDMSSGRGEGDAAFEAIFAKGSRICISMNDPPEWYGALLGDRLEIDGGMAFEVGFDDGEVRLMLESVLRESWDNSLAAAADPEKEGIIANTAGCEMAVAFVQHKFKDTFKTVGLMISSGSGTLLGQPIQSSLYAFPNHWPNQSKRARSSMSMQDRLGLHTFRRGDFVQYEHREADEPHFDVAVFGLLEHPAGSGAETRWTDSSFYMR